jgi:cyclase
MKILLLAITALGLGAWNGTTQEPAPEIQVIEVTENIAMLKGFGGNIGVMKGDDGVLMIDTQFAQFEEDIRKAMAKFTEGKPTYVVNTHWHGDHVGGNLAFGKDGLLIAHQNVRLRMIKGGRGNGPADPAALPEITFDDGLTLHWNGEPVHVIHLPVGHTDGDSVVIFSKSKVVHMGDLMFHKLFPFIDASSGGNARGYVKSLQAVLKQIPADAKIIPGHGELATRDDLVAEVAMIEDCIAIMEQRIKDGMSREDAVDAGLPEKYAAWSWQFITTEKWLDALYQELSKKDQ